MTPTRRPLVVVLVGAGLAVVALEAAGRGTLAGPPLTSWPTVETWYDQAGPAVAALAGLRLAALGGAGWVLVATALQLVAGLAPCRTVQQLADAVSPVALRQLSQGVAGLAVGVGLLGPPAPATPRVDPPGIAVMEVLDPAQPTTTSTATTTVAPPGDRAAAVPAPVAPPDDEVVVAAGDSFWSLAVDAVADHQQPPAVDDYWRRLVAANRARLVDPANPDLLYPGQVLTLPPLDA